MKTYKIKADKGEDGKRRLCINGLITSVELHAIKRKMEKKHLTVDKLPVKKWVEIDLFDYDF
jgi:hypothetical protein